MEGTANETHLARGTPESAARQGEEPTGALLREALDETRHLVRLEVALARDEAMSELASAKKAALALAGATAAGIAALTMFLVALALMFDDPRLAAAAIGAVAALLAAGLAFAGWRALPKQPLGEAKRRVEADLKQLKERVV